MNSNRATLFNIQIVRASSALLRTDRYASNYERNLTEPSIVRRTAMSGEPLAIRFI